MLVQLGLATVPWYRALLQCELVRRDCQEGLT